MELQTHRLYKGQVKIVFSPRYHAYYLNEYATENRLWGVTSATGMIDKSGPLMWWAVNKCAIPYLKERILPGKSYDEVELMKMFDEAGREPNRKKSEAGAIGKLIHEWCERWIKWSINQREVLHPDFLQKPEMPTSPIMVNGVTSFLGWVEQHKVEFLHSEKVVYSKKHRYVGTMDAEAIVDGELAVVDFKTSNGLYDEYRFQAAAYLNARQEETKKKYQSYWLVRFDKESKKDDEGNDYVEFEARRNDIADFPADFAAFVGALSVLKRKKQLDAEKDDSYPLGRRK